MNVVDSTKSCSLMMLDKDNSLLRIFDAIGLDREIIQSFSLQLGQGIAGWVAQVGRPRVIRDVTDEIECPDFFGREMAFKLNYGAMACLPLKTSGSVFGVINLFLGRPREFSDSEVKVLETMAAYAALALQNAQLHLDMERYNLHLSKVRALVRDAGQQTDLESIFKKILITAGNVADTNKSYLVHLEPTIGAWKFSFPEGDQSHQAKLPKVEQGEGIAAHVLKTGWPYIVEDIEHDEHYFPIWKKVRWEMAVPFVVDGKPQGCLVVASDKAPPSHQMQLIVMLADAVAIALRNKRLYGIAEKKTQQVITAHGIGEALSHENSLQEILSLIANECLNVVGRENKISFLWIKDQERRKLVLKAVTGEAFGRKHVGKSLSLNQRSIIVWVAKNGLPRLANDVMQDPEYLQAHPDIKSEIAVPLIFRDEIIGVIDLQSLSRNDFDVQDLENLTAVAHNAAVAVKIGELYDVRIKAEIGLSKILEAAAIEEVVAGLTHDIKNISSMIAGETQWLQKRGSEKRLHFNEIETAIKNINGYVTRIEDYANYLNSRAFKQPPELRWCNLRNVVGEAVQVISVKALRQRVDIKMDENALDVRVYVDSGRLVRAFFNIITNAIDAMPEGGALKIYARHRGKGQIRIFFSDNGMGIPEEHLHKVLHHFFTTKERGYGLGLTITKRIVETDHRGKLLIRSKQGRGTTVEVRIPRNLHFRTENNNGAHEKSSNSKFHHTNKANRRAGNVLVVNDDADMLNKITQILRAEGHSVTGAESGKAAVDLCTKQKFDAIVLDYHLKKDHSRTQTAGDFLQDFRKAAPMTPIILTSATLDNSSAPEMNCDFFLEINQSFWHKILDLINNCLMGKLQVPAN
jgi:signal transduction histidine kinase/CheY-like chemotaxis protein